MFGQQPDGSEKPAPMELVRLAFPRRTYTQSHVDYIAEVLVYVEEIKTLIQEGKIVESPPVLRHFSDRMAPVQEVLITPNRAP